MEGGGVHAARKRGVVGDEVFPTREPEIAEYDKFLSYYEFFFEKIWLKTFQLWASTSWTLFAGGKVHKKITRKCVPLVAEDSNLEKNRGCRATVGLLRRIWFSGWEQEHSMRPLFKSNSKFSVSLLQDSNKNPANKQNKILFKINLFILNIILLETLQVLLTPF